MSVTVDPHTHLGPFTAPPCGRQPITHHGFEQCAGRPHPVTLPSRAHEAMARQDRYSVGWYDARTSLWDALAARNLSYGRGPDELSPLTGGVLVFCPTCGAQLPGLLAGCQREGCRRRELDEDRAYERLADQ